MVVGEKTRYGDHGEVTSKEYDRCFIDAFEKGARGYTVKIVKQDSAYSNGTTYEFIKKPQEA